MLRYLSHGVSLSCYANFSGNVDIHALLMGIFVFRSSDLSRDDEKIIIFFVDENKYFSPSSCFIN